MGRTRMLDHGALVVDSVETLIVCCEHVLDTNLDSKDESGSVTDMLIGFRKHLNCSLRSFLRDSYGRGFSKPAQVRTSYHGMLINELAESYFESL